MTGVDEAVADETLVTDDGVVSASTMLECVEFDSVLTGVDAESWVSAGGVSAFGATVGALV